MRQETFFLYRFLRFFRLSYKHKRFERNISYLLAFLAIAGGAATFLAFKGTSPFEVTSTRLLGLLSFDLFVFLGLVVLIARRVVSLWMDRRQGKVASRLHVRFTGIFGLLTGVPAFLVMGFSIAFFYYGFQGWFQERVSTALQASRSVAQAYLHEHERVLAVDATLTAYELYQKFPFMEDEDTNKVSDYLSDVARSRGLGEIMIFDAANNIKARSNLTLAMVFDFIPPHALAEAHQSSAPVLMVSEQNDRVRALIKLRKPEGMYLYVGRLIDPDVIAQMQRTESAVGEYTRIQGQLAQFQFIFIAVFVVVTIMLVMVAIWVGLWAAGQLVQPITQLIKAAEEVGRGNFRVRVAIRGKDELSMLGRSFNRMTRQIAAQQTELVTINDRLEERHRFIETVLSDVTGGVIGLDAKQRIRVCNPAARKFLEIPSQGGEGKKLTFYFPEAEEFLKNGAECTKEQDKKLLRLDGEIRLARRGHHYVFMMRLMPMFNTKGTLDGYTLTFDDLSPLLAAQKQAAWSEVARRVAHEIKNPLTPIQLASERLLRKYAKEIVHDRQKFEESVHTIIRQVCHIGAMVDEFSAFSRLPMPVFEQHDVCKICQEVLILEKGAYPDIQFESVLPSGAVHLVCDPQQLSQALLNLLKNAIESIHESDQDRGHIALQLEEYPTAVLITIDDNGKGLPTADLGQLTEPYFTTRAKGTGLGLSIVKKIVDDHEGHLSLKNNPKGGARVVLTLPKKTEQGFNNV